MKGWDGLIQPKCFPLPIDIWRETLKITVFSFSDFFQEKETLYTEWM